MDYLKTYFESLARLNEVDLADEHDAYRLYEILARASHERLHVLVENKIVNKQMKELIEDSEKQDRRFECLESFLNVFVNDLAKSEKFDNYKRLANKFGLIFARKTDGTYLIDYVPGFKIKKKRNLFAKFEDLKSSR